MKKYCIITVALLCMFGSGQATPAIEYSGRIINDIGRPVDSATITIENYSNRSETFTAMTDTTGLFSFDMVNVEDSAPVPFKLYGNFPNPFNPGTRISYSLDSSAEVSIDIYNVLGQRVRSLEQGYRDAGFYTAVWDGRDDSGMTGSAGVYIYRLQADDRSISSKMLMVDASTGSWINERSVPSTVFKAASENLYLVTVTHPDTRTLSLGPMTVNETSDATLILERYLNKEVLVQKTRFMRGTNKRQYPYIFPEHAVEITHDFYMYKYEMTPGQFCDVMNHALIRGVLTFDPPFVKNTEGESKILFTYYDDTLSGNAAIEYVDDKFSPIEGLDKVPVSFVSWYGAMFYCYERNLMEGLPQPIDVTDWSYEIKVPGYRLPTDSEWELTAKWTDNREYAFGPDPGHFKPINVQLNDDGFDNELSPVGWFSPQGDSYHSLCDLSGNVYEWVLDWQREYNVKWAKTVQIDPTGPEKGINKTARGGSAYGCFRSARTFDKANIVVSETMKHIGFRPIRVVAE